jgi:hypothetical protein
MIFVERSNLFSTVDVVIYHPGHFPELNIQISGLYLAEGFKKIYLPNVYNKFLQDYEFEYHKPLLIDLGIPSEIIFPIQGQHQNGNDVVRAAVQGLDKEERHILLAGKAFFCRRFLTLASLHGREDCLFDVYPLIDDRDINHMNWAISEKGRARIMNEMKVLSEIVNFSEEEVRDFTSRFERT